MALGGGRGLYAQALAGGFVPDFAPVEIELARAALVNDRLDRQVDVARAYNVLRLVKPLYR